MTGDAATLAVPPPAGDGPLATLDGAALRRWAQLVARRLHEVRAELDALNVFPVPDGDTGTNLHLTVHGALSEDAGDLPRAMLVNARGNSGVIASQLVRGWVDVLTVSGGEVKTGAGAGGGAQAVAKALRRGDELAWAAVSEPVEGTVLSVSRAAAEEAERVAATDAGLPQLVASVVAAAEQALDRTPLQLPALAAAGVVDAGGAGLVVALRALRDVVEGVDGTEGTSHDGSSLLDRVGGDLAGRGVAGTDLDPDGPSYEVMYLLATEAESGAADDDPGERLRDALAALGDSVLVVGGDGLWHVHVHTDDPGAAVEAGLAVGAPRTIRITHFEAAAREARDGCDAPVGAPSGRPAGPWAPLAVVACAGGAATLGLCLDAGAVVVLSAPGERASTGDVLTAVLAAGAAAERVLVLPNDAETAAVAHQAALAAEEQCVTVVVARSRSQVQVLAALAVLGPGATGATGGADVSVALRSVAAAVEGCRYGAVTVAARDGWTSAGSCRTGDLVGTVGRDVVAVGSDPVEVAVQVVAVLGGDDAELLTVLPGQDAGPELVQRLVGRLQAGGGRRHVDVVGGGQPRYLLLLGCE